MRDPVLEGKGISCGRPRTLSQSPQRVRAEGEGFREGRPYACYNAATSPSARTLKFGHFLYHVNLDPEHDAQGIRDALAEARLAEDLGYDALWFSEHHFTGEVVYADPLVFAAAVAVQTKRVTLGLGVIEMAFHHPVQTAIQTALLDNLSEGRLIVGTARGSSYNAFEYMGFGTSIEEQTGRIDEAEELLALAWTGKDVRFHGKHFHAEFPAVRPRPVQQPHPPLYRACVSRGSLTAMARQGRLVVLRTWNAKEAAEQTALYRSVMLDEGFTEERVEANLDRAWMWRDVYVAETDKQAADEFFPGWHRYQRTLNEFRAQWSPPDQPVYQSPDTMPPPDYSERPHPEASDPFVGSPERVAEQIAQLQENGVRNLMITHYGAAVSHENAVKSMRLLAEKVFPRFR